MLNKIKFLYILSSFLLVTFLTSSTALAKLPKGLRKNAESVKELGRILVCSRRFISEFRGGSESVVHSLVYLKRAQEIFGDEQLMAELRKACDSELQEVAVVPNTTSEELNTKLQEQAGKYPVAALDIVSTFITAKGSCRFISFGFNVGIVASFGLGMKAFKCESEDGRRFVAWAPEFADGFGIGATVSAGGGRMEMEKVESSRISGVYESQSSTNGLIIVLQDTHSRGEVKYVIKEKAFGVGLGYFNQNRQFPVMKVFGQGDHLDELITHLLNL